MPYRTKFVNRLMGEIDPLLAALPKCPTVYHTVAFQKSVLIDHGYTELKESASWYSVPSKFFVVRDGRSLAAFNIHDKSRGIFIVSPCDSPALRVKANSSLSHLDLEQLRPVLYGDLKPCSYFDCELKIAGRALIQGNPPRRQLFESPHPVCIIPSPPTKLLKEVFSPGASEGTFSPIISFSNSYPAIAPNQNSAILSVIAHELHCDPSAILESDIFLVNADPPKFSGSSGEYLTGPRIDVTSSLIPSLHAFVEAKDPEIGFVSFTSLDNHAVMGRIGETRVGPNSLFLAKILDRIGIPDHQRANSIIFAVESTKTLNLNFDAVPPTPSEYGWPGEGLIYRRSHNRRLVTDQIAELQVVKFAESLGIKVNVITDTARFFDGMSAAKMIACQLGVAAHLIGVPIMGKGSSRETSAVDDLLKLKLLLKSIIEEWFKLPPVREIE
jgi:aspartyl aminopeptidase